MELVSTLAILLGEGTGACVAYDVALAGINITDYIV